MGYPEFLSALLTEGYGSVARPAVLSDVELSAADEILARVEAIRRLELPGLAPIYSAPGAAWAGRQLYRACQFLLFRDLGDDELKRELSEPGPSAASPSEHYSVDLVFRFLPDVWRAAVAASPADPLLPYLQQWGRAWPLSSCGMPDLGGLDISGFTESPSLLTLYVDRLVAAGDVTRLADERIREQLRAHLGIHPQLAKRLPANIRQCLAEHAESA